MMDMEVNEGELREDHGVLFKKVGADLCVLDAEAEGGGGRHGFSTIPLQALAVSNKFGLTFFVHSDGFCVARTADLVQASQQLVDTPKAKCSAKERCITSVTLSNIQMLALSSNELTIAACLESTIQFYNVPMLLQKRQGGNSAEVSDDPVSVLDNKLAIKVFAWSPTRKDTYFCLSREGTLKSGVFMHECKVIAEGVVAADWSPDGEYLAYITQDMSLHAFKVASSEISNFVLPRKMFGETSLDELQVDMVKWLRLDSMLVTFVHIDVDGQEDDCLIFVLTSRGGHIAKDAKAAELLSYDQFFTSIDTSIIPCGTGPYVIANYVQPWEMALVTNRRSIDDHIAVLGWLQEEDNLEPYKFELVNDNFIPRIELQECGDDNGVIGMAVDLTTSSIQLLAPSGEGGEKLPPGPLLLCMTLEGYLILFAIARTDSKWIDIEIITTAEAVPDADDLVVSQKLRGEPAQDEPTKNPQDEPTKNLSARDEVLSSEDKREQSQTPSFTGIQEERAGLINLPKEATISSQPSNASIFETKQLPHPPTSAMMPHKSAQQTQGHSAIHESKPVQQVEEPLLVASKPLQYAQGPAVRPSKPVQQAQGSSAAGLQASKPLQQVQGPSALAVQVSKPMQQAQGPPTSSIQASKPTQQTQGRLASGIQSKDPAMLGPKQVRDSGALSMQPKTSGLSKLEPNRGSFLSDMEADFVNELDKVKAMAKELEELLSLIEERGSVRKGDQRRIFTKSFLIAVESGIQKLSGTCHQFQAELKDQRQYISDLWDETMQVDAWRIYVQSLLEQTSDNHYQDLWNKQRLHPEMDTMRKRILKDDQLLKHQIAELEEHIHNLELSQWWKKHSQSASQTKRPLQTSENFYRMQALYGTVNTQMGVAQQLSEQLAAQIDALKLYSITKEGVSGLIDMSASKLQSMGLNEVSAKKGSEHLSRSRPAPFQRDSADGSPLSTGLNYTLSTPQKPDNVLGMNASLQDSTRRRRDSLDKLWSDVGTAKTTVKRATPARPSERVSPSTARGVFQNENSQVKPSSPLCTTQPATLPTEIAEGGAIMSKPQLSTLKRNQRPSQTGKVFSFDKPEWKYSYEVDDSNTTNLSNSFSDSVPAVSIQDALRFGTTDVMSKAVAPNSRESSDTFSLESSGLQPAASQPLSKLGGLAESCVSPSSTQQATLLKFTVQDMTRIGGVPKKVEAGINVERSKMQPHIGHENTSRAPSLLKVPQQSKASVAMASGKVQRNDLSLKMAEGLGIEKTNTLAKHKTASSTESIDKLNLDPLLPTLSGTTFPSTPAGAKATTSVSTSMTFSCPSTCLSSVPLTSVGTSSLHFGSSSQPTTSAQESISQGGISSTSTAAQITPLVAISSAATPQLIAPLPTVTALPISSPISVSQTTTIPVISGQLVMPPTTAPAISVQPSVSSPTISSLTTFPSLIPPSTSTSPVFSFGSAFGTSSPNSANLFGGEGKALGPQTLAPAANAETPFTALAPPTVSDEEEMEEEVSSSMLDFGSGSFSGFGLGSSTPAGGPQNTNSFFGGSLFGSQPSSGIPMSVPSGQLFKPAAFSLPTPETSPQQGTGSSFGSSFGSGIGGNFSAGSSPFSNSARSSTPAFGQPAQPGLGQQVLGNSLGAFGQTRQLGSPFGAPSFPTTGSSFATGGGFAGAATGGGFASAATGGGFASAATGGGFAGAATGGGFASAATGGGFAGFSSSTSFPVASGGGFQSFPSRPGGAAAFGGNFSTLGSTNPSVFTQMRK